MAKDQIHENTKDLIVKSSGFMGWIQEFSKKIVAVTFFMFLAINIFVMVMITLHYITSGGDIIYLDQLLSEAHVTFRDVIGGYIIKAATENVIKISGSLLDRFLATRIKEKEMDHGVVEEPFVEEESNPNPPTNEGQLVFSGNDLPLDEPNYIPEGGGKG